MKGLLRRFFAPRWQHPDPAIRRQSVARLNAGQQHDRERLEQLAGDTEASVRQAALDKLSDPAALIDLLSRDDSKELRTRLVTLLTGRDVSPPLATRLALTKRITDPSLLTQLALHGDNQELRLAALERLDDETALIHQACENSIAAVRHAAAERVISESGLATLSRQARRDKQVARLARERLNRMRQDFAQSEAQAAERQRILQSLEQHAQHTWEPLYAGRYRHLQRAWENLDDLPSAEQEHRYQEACQRCRKTISDHEAQRHATASIDQHRNNADEARRSLVEALEDSLTHLRQNPHLHTQDLASLHAQKRLLASRWQQLSDLHAPNDTIRQRYDQALTEYEYISQLAARFEKHREALQEALRQQDAAQLQELVGALDWPLDIPPTPLLARIRTQLPDIRLSSADAKQRTKRFEQSLTELEHSLDRGAFKQAEHLHQRLRQHIETLPLQQRHLHQPTLKRLGAQLAELRDWRSFAAGPKREHLCQAIDELAEDQALPDTELDRRHRLLVNEWKSLGDAASSRDLSGRFRAASDRIHERLGPWREAREQERQQNLSARQALCEQLEALIDNPDPRADPDALRQIRDRSREQWRRFSPVPRDSAEAIGQRFGQVRHALQMLIDQRAQEIAEAKRVLIEQARQLQSSSQAATQRAEQAKSLQQRWRELGRAPKGEEQILWREFRSLCDNIFAARDGERKDRAQRVREQLDAMQALIERIDAWQPISSRDMGILNDAINEAERLEPLPPGRRSDGMRRRWSGIVRARHDRVVRLELKELIDRWQSLQPLLEAHLSADNRALQGHAFETVNAEETLMDAPMQRAHEQRNLARQAPVEAARIEEDLARLRVHLALLAGGEVGREDEPLRLAIQVERLNHGLGQERSKASELHKVLCNILATGPVPPGLWAREASELNRLLSRLAHLPPP